MEGMTSTDADTVERSARAYLLYVFGCVLFPDTSATRAPCSWLEFLSNMGTVDQYAWGAALLAYTYRRLGEASMYSRRQTSGYMTLVEVRRNFITI